MTKRSALDLIDDWLATGFTARSPEGRRGGAAPDDGSTAESASNLRQAELSAVALEVEGCARCQLSLNRTHTVPGEGSIDPPVLFVGEGPGEEEDRTGRPFVGAAGRYLDKWIAAAGLDRGACFIANCVKCRPPQNREPHPDEIGACLPYLERQIAALAPRAIMCVGRIASQALLGTSTGVGALRGKVHDRKGIPLLVTYHPSAVLRDQTLRAPVWEDLKCLKGLLAHA
ncbi:MAG: uracil-DNA glycosylase [Spirochaetes bacterium]|nr:uracil-DNA glycosylase [Spirochaetota bacterium]